MKPETKGAKTTGVSGGRNLKRWFLQGAFAVLVVLTGGVFYYLYRDEPPVQEDKTPRAASLAPRRFLPAHGRSPRTKSLDPAKFSDPEVRSAYEVARSDPELLESMPCYCGCYSTSGHFSNYDCFVDDHGAT